MLSDVWFWGRVVAPLVLTWLVVLVAGTALDRALAARAARSGRMAPEVRATRVVLWSYLLAGAISATLLDGTTTYQRWVHGWPLQVDFVGSLLWVLS